MPRTILLLPFFDEAATLVPVLDRAAPFGDVVILVDDGSTDGSSELAREWAGGRPHVHLVSHPRNRGMAAALRSGMLVVSLGIDQGWLDASDVVVMLDADGQHRPEDVAGLAARLSARSCELAIGRRDLSNYPLHKRWGNFVMSALCSILANRRLRDSECGLRAMTAALVPRILCYYTGYRYSCAIEIAVIACGLGCAVDDGFPLRVPHYRRRGATAKDGLPNVFMGLLALLRVRLDLRNDHGAALRRLARHLRGGPEAVAVSLREP